MFFPVRGLIYYNYILLIQHAMCSSYILSQANYFQMLQSILEVYLTMHGIAGYKNLEENILEYQKVIFKHY